MQKLQSLKLGYVQEAHKKDNFCTIFRSWDKNYCRMVCGLLE